MRKTVAAAVAIGTLAAAIGSASAPASAVTPRGADTTFRILNAGSVSVLGNKGDILGGTVTNGTGKVGVEILSQQLQATLTSASATATTFNTNITLVALGQTLHMQAALTGSSWTYSGVTTGDLQLTFTGLKVQPANPTKVHQVPVKCTAMPDTLKRRGTTLVFARTCRTNAGQKVWVGLHTSARTRGDVSVPIARLVYGANGRVAIKTYGRPGSVVLVESAPAKAGYYGYRNVRRFTL